VISQKIFQPPSLISNKIINVISTIFLAGLIEEVVFRGFILRKALENNNFITSNILQSILFAVIHIPIWIIKDQNIAMLLVYIFIFGLLMGYINRKSRSLWTVIILHTLHNLSIA